MHKCGKTRAKKDHGWTGHHEGSTHVLVQNDVVHSILQIGPQGRKVAPFQALEGNLLHARTEDVVHLGQILADQYWALSSVVGLVYGVSSAPSGEGHAMYGARMARAHGTFTSASFSCEGAPGCISELFPFGVTPWGISPAHDSLCESTLILLSKLRLA